MVVVSLLVLPLCLLLWLLAFDRMFRGRPILDWEPRRRVPWNGVDLLMAAMIGLIVLLLTQWLVASLLDLPTGGWALEDLRPTQQIAIISAFSMSSVVTMALAACFFRWRSGATWSDLGICSTQFPRDVQIGVAGYLMLIVPMLFIHFLAQKLLATEEQHPFVELLSKDPQLGYLLPIALAACIAAPLAEEFFFRLALQGWLETFMARRSPVRLGADLPPDKDSTADDGSCLTGHSLSADDVLCNSASQVASSPADVSAQEGSESDAAEWDHLSAAADSAERPSRQPRMETPEQPESAEEPPGWFAHFWPIAVSSLIFSLAHFGHGAAPVGLFFLAIGLGYIYQRTHRILPTMIVHFLVNLTAILQLWEYISSRAPS